MRILVTGCAGFIGSHLVDKLLERGYEVIGRDCFMDYYHREIKEKNIENALKNNNFKLIEEDIMNMDNFPEVNHVFHLAAQAGVRASWGKSFEIYTRNNIEAIQKLLEFYKDRKIKKFVYASSSSVYGDAELPMKEDSLLKPVSPYGVTKLAAENLCYLYWKNYGVPTVSLRYFTVYGPRQRPDMAIHKFVKAILNGDEITVFGDGTQTRDFTFIDDVVEANILAANSEIEGEVFNVGGGSRISVNKLIELLEKITEKNAKIKYIEKQKGDVRDTLADTSKISNELNWKPKVKIKEGLKRFVEWYKSLYKHI
ncbi:MAG: GDP-mannose 4,6-dehydratase [Candidatus Syntrophoarchaeum sp.]|nr:GDP-mannose 4,6-dehydratase [Methanomicrobia archaeon]MBL7117730.1 GDP-mannose 4,6-dehydratase [Candidatus Syntrophoarchaeum sp.]